MPAKKSQFDWALWSHTQTSIDSLRPSGARARVGRPIPPGVWCGWGGPLPCSHFFASRFFPSLSPCASFSLSLPFYCVSISYVVLNVHHSVVCQAGRRCGTEAVESQKRSKGRGEDVENRRASCLHLLLLLLQPIRGPLQAHTGEPMRRGCNHKTTEGVFPAAWARWNNNIK